MIWLLAGALALVPATNFKGVQLYKKPKRKKEKNEGPEKNRL